MEEKYSGEGRVEHVGVGPEPSRHRLNRQVEEAVVEAQPEPERGQEQDGSTEDGDVRDGLQPTTQFDSVIVRSGEHAVELPA